MIGTSTGRGSGSGSRAARRATGASRTSLVPTLPARSVIRHDTTVVRGRLPNGLGGGRRGDGGQRAGHRRGGRTGGTRVLPGHQSGPARRGGARGAGRLARPARARGGRSSSLVPRVGGPFPRGACGGGRGGGRSGVGGDDGDGHRPPLDPRARQGALGGGVRRRDRRRHDLGLRTHGVRGPGRSDDARRCTTDDRLTGPARGGRRPAAVQLARVGDGEQGPTGPPHREHGGGQGSPDLPGSRARRCGSARGGPAARRAQRPQRARGRLGASGWSRTPTSTWSRSPAESRRGAP